jgi:hypothetical protein
LLARHLDVISVRIPHEPAAVTLVADRIVPTAGLQSRGHPTYRVSLELARKLGRRMAELPGGHAGYATNPAEFAGAFVRAAKFGEA